MKNKGMKNKHRTQTMAGCTLFSSPWCYLLFPRPIWDVRFLNIPDPPELLSPGAHLIKKWKIEKFLLRIKHQIRF